MSGNKVYDCFPFWKEFEVLRLRLNELSEVVDKFIIVESSYTHSGQKKELYLKNNMNLFKEFEEKIILISSTKKLFIANSNRRENYQRNLINLGLKRLNPKQNDLVLISDCDEIPRASVVLMLKNEPKNCIFELDGYISWFNLFLQKWQRGRALPYKDFKGAQHAHRDHFIQLAQHMRRSKAIPLLRINPFFSLGFFDKHFGAWVGFKGKPSIEVIKNAGWHFTKIFPPEVILESINATSHTEFNLHNIDIEYIIDKRKNFSTYYGGEATGKKVELDESFPQYILSNKGKLKQYLL